MSMSGERMSGGRLSGGLMSGGLMSAHRRKRMRFMQRLNMYFQSFTRVMHAQCERVSPALRTRVVCHPSLI